MTQEDKDKIAGQARREYREAKQELAALHAKAGQLGNRLAEVARILSKTPSSLIFDGQGYDGRFVLTHEPFKDSEFAEFTATKMRELGDSIRRQIVKTGDLRQRLTEIEGEDPERTSSTGPHF